MSAISKYQYDFEEYSQLLGLKEDKSFENLNETEQKKLLELIKSAFDIVQKDHKMCISSIDINKKDISTVATVNIGLKDEGISLIELSKELNEITSKNEALLI